MISRADYWMGRDDTHPLDMTPQIERNAFLTVELVNKVLVLAHVHGIDTPQSPRTGSNLTSGWRPPSVNASIPGAAVRSKHMTGQAADIYDPEGELDEWLLAHEQILKDLGLWMEHPAATKGWAHVQTVPPGSGRRVFYP
jgi:hypothetical protein